MSGPPDTLAVLLDKADRGEVDASGGLFAALYEELHRLAQSHIRRRGGNVTLGVTTLLHEAYLDISGREALAFLDRNRFMGYASRVMRGLVIDYVRGHNAQKRGGDLTFTTLDEGRAPVSSASDELEALSAALDELATREPGLAELVDLKFFCGFSFVEIAGIRGISERTVQRDWAKARLMLHQALRDDGERA